MCHADTIHWVESLPLVLLGIRSAFKEDLQATSAELVYGQPLRLPGELIAAPAADTESPSELLARLRQHFSKLRPTLASRHANPSTFVFKDLTKCSHVLLRVDRVRRSLEEPYIGPFKVIKWDDSGKTVDLDLHGKTETVSVDRVKPAYMLAGDVHTDAAPGRPLSERQPQQPEANAARPPLLTPANAVPACPPAAAAPHMTRA
ncbi:hypothetical protein FOCC_FOCC017032, partial [Frankliniella occidentalis]